MGIVPCRRRLPIPLVAGTLAIGMFASTAAAAVAADARLVGEGRRPLHLLSTPLLDAQPLMRGRGATVLVGAIGRLPHPCGFAHLDDVRLKIDRSHAASNLLALAAFLHRTA